jgi:hypothetical protein
LHHSPCGSPVGISLPTEGASRVASVSPVLTCRHHYPGGTAGSDRSNEGLSTPGYSPATAAFPELLAGRLPRQIFRGLFSVHSRYGLPTRCTARRHICLEGSDGFVTSTAAPIASGWSDQTWPGGTCTHWETVPYHGAQYNVLYLSGNIARIGHGGNRNRSQKSERASTIISGSVVPDSPGTFADRWRLTHRPRPTPSPGLPLLLLVRVRVIEPPIVLGLHQGWRPSIQ